MTRPHRRPPGALHDLTRRPGRRGCVDDWRTVAALWLEAHPGLVACRQHARLRATPSQLPALERILPPNYDYIVCEYESLGSDDGESRFELHDLTRRRGCVADCGEIGRSSTGGGGALIQQLLAATDNWRGTLQHWSSAEPAASAVAAALLPLLLRACAGRASARARVWSETLA